MEKGDCALFSALLCPAVCPCSTGCYCAVRSAAYCRQPRGGDSPRDFVCGFKLPPIHRTPKVEDYSSFSTTAWSVIHPADFEYEVRHPFRLGNSTTTIHAPPALLSHTNTLGSIANPFTDEIDVVHQVFGLHAPSTPGSSGTKPGTHLPQDREGLYQVLLKTEMCYALSNAKDGNSCSIDTSVGLMNGSLSSETATLYA